MEKYAGMNAFVLLALGRVGMILQLLLVDKGVWGLEENFKSCCSNAPLSLAMDGSGGVEKQTEE